MTNFVFADRYAEAGLAPTSQRISSRQAPAERIVDDITIEKIFDLVGIYYGSPGLELSWFREEFAQEDASFSLINNERETRVLAATMLGALMASGSSEAILAVVTGYVAGHRTPLEASGVISDAFQKLATLSVSDRIPANIDFKVTPTATPKLGEEIDEIEPNDWASLLLVLNKLRAESQSSARTTASQTVDLLKALNVQMGQLREESQMLWWLFGGHSRAIERSFSTFGPAQAAIIGAVDLGALTTSTDFGPIAAPAMLERIIAMAKRPKGAGTKDLASAIDSFSREDLLHLKPLRDTVPARLAPVTTAIVLAQTIGIGAWHAKFLEVTGFEATLNFEPIELASQLYREYLLGQLI